MEWQDWIAAKIAATIEQRFGEPDDPTDSFHAWRRCHAALGREDLGAEDLCLHLSAFLSSFGMMRGSSPIFSTNYTVHEPVVAILRGPEAMALRRSATISGATINDLLLMAEQIRASYGPVRVVTYTLATKIMLGALGCVPAYDRFVCNGLQAAGGVQRFGKRSLMSIVELVEVYGDEFAGAEQLGYPLPRVVDMALKAVGETPQADRP